MAKKLNVLKAGNAVPYADGGLKLSKSIRIDEIEPHEDFQTLFPIKEDVLNHITENMKLKGFKGNHPVDIWLKTDEDGTVHKYLIDGYTRIQAAKNAGLETVPYYEFKFETFDEALKEALGEQVNRRNLDGADLINAVEKLYGTDFIQNTEGKKSEAIAEIIGISPRTTEKAISIIRDADEDTLQQIKDNELSVNKAYEKKHPKKVKKETRDEALERNVAPDDSDSSEDSDMEDFEDLSDSLDDNDGNTRSITVRSRNMSEFLQTPEESDDDRRLIERFEEGFLAGFKISVSEVCWKIFYIMKSLLEQGKTIHDIESDKTFEDFSYSVIAPYLDIPTNDEEILKEFNK